MANTYTQLLIHFVFIVKNRQNLISETIRPQVQKIIWKLAENTKSKPLAVFCNPDHTHLLVGLETTISVATFMKKIKSESSFIINSNGLVSNKFEWQNGYGAFSISKRSIDRVARYILNQAEHHRAKSFREEYIEMLRLNDIKYDDKYLFDFIY